MACLLCGYSTSSNAWRCRFLPQAPGQGVSVVTKPGLRDRPAVDQIEIGPVAVAVLGLLPATGDGVSVFTDGGDETLSEWRACPPELPLAIADGHLIDPTHAALVRIKLEVGPIGCVAAHHRHAV